MGERHDDDQDIGINPSTSETLEAIVARRLTRRDALKGLAASGRVRAVRCSCR